MGGLRGRGEGVSEARRHARGEKEGRHGEVRELFMHKVFGALTGFRYICWEVESDLDAVDIHKYNL